MEQSIAQLSNQVRALSLQVEELQKEIRQNNQRQQTPQQIKQRHQNNSAPSLAPTHNTGVTYTTPAFIYQPGDRIRILNKVRRPTNWDDPAKWNAATARKATVTSVTSTRV
jgi:TolA-binding protein